MVLKVIQMIIYLEDMVLSEERHLLKTFTTWFNEGSKNMVPDIEDLTDERKRQTKVRTTRCDRSYS